MPALIWKIFSKVFWFWNKHNWNKARCVWLDNLVHSMDFNVLCHSRLLPPWKAKAKINFSSLQLLVLITPLPSFSAFQMMCIKHINVDTSKSVFHSKPRKKMIWQMIWKIWIFSFLFIKWRWAVSFNFFRQIFMN